jgi:hypothetical protein
MVQVRMNVMVFIYLLPDTLQITQDLRLAGRALPIPPQYYIFLRVYIYWYTIFHRHVCSRDRDLTAVRYFKPRGSLRPT